MNVALLHLDLGIGGAEKFVVSAALALKQNGHRVTIFTTHHDPSHCFEETLNKDQLGDDIVVCGDWLPASSGAGGGRGISRLLGVGSATAVSASIRMVYLAAVVLATRWLPGRMDAVLIDGVSTPLPLFALCGVPSLFYCHYPDKMLCLNRNSSWLKKLYRDVLDTLEEVTTGCATRVLVNSKYTASVFAEAFAQLSRTCKPDVLYPVVEFETDENVNQCRDSAAELIPYAVVRAQGHVEMEADEDEDLDCGNEDAAEGSAVRRRPKGAAKGKGKSKGKTGVSVQQQPVKRTESTVSAAGAPCDTLCLAFDHVFVSLNRYERKKNIGLALDTMYHIAQQEQQQLGGREPSQVLLVVAGGYDDRVAENVEHLEELRAKAEQHGFTVLPPDFNAATAGKRQHRGSGKRVHVSVVFRTSISLAERTALLTFATALLYTPHNEHFGIVPIEAMYLRCPVVAVRSGGPMETVLDGKTGFLCDQNAASFGQAVLRFMHPAPGDVTVNCKRCKSVGGALCEALGTAGRRHVQRTFSPDTLRQHLQQHMTDIRRIHGRTDAATRGMTTSTSLSGKERGALMRVRFYLTAIALHLATWLVVAICVALVVSWSRRWRSFFQ